MTNAAIISAAAVSSGSTPLQQAMSEKYLTATNPRDDEIPTT